VSDLEVDGHDVMEMGVPGGPEVGRVLDIVFDAVLDGAVENRQDRLLDYLRGII